MSLDQLLRERERDGCCLWCGARKRGPICPTCHTEQEDPMLDKLPHTRRTQRMIAAGKRAEAIKAHNQRVQSELARAQAGETINLSDLMAAREELEITRGDAA